ncbi:hypothetical protein ACFL51_02145 [Myxococcota bacterium]
MKKVYLPLAVVAVLSFTVAATSCKSDCEKGAEKYAKCMKELKEEPEKDRFQKACKNNEKGLKDRMKKCLKKDSCSDFLACIGGK